MEDINKKLEKIRKIVGKTVIFKIGMKKPGKADILAMQAFHTEDDLDEDYYIDSDQGQEEKPYYVG